MARRPSRAARRGNLPSGFINSHLISGEVIGAKQLDNALKQLPKATAKNVLRRALLKSAKPAEAATLQTLRTVTTRRTGNLEDSIEISTKLKETQNSGGEPGSVEVFIGAASDGGKKGHHAHLVEFGTAHSNPHPFLRPAWESTKNIVLGTFADEVWKAIAKAARTLARKAEKGTLSRNVRRHLNR